MNFKIKALGFVAGTSLALSVASGAMAQTTTTVELLDNGVCTIAITSGNIDFGTYTYSPGSDTFVKDGSSTSTITVEATDTTNDQEGCDATISEGDMTRLSSTINVQYTHNGFGPAETALVDVQASTDETVTASIPSTLDTAYVTGEYNGTIVVTQGDGARL